MGWVSATQYEPEFWGKMPAKPAVIDPIDPPFRAAPVVDSTSTAWTQCSLCCALSVA